MEMYTRTIFFLVFTVGNCVNANDETTYTISAGDTVQVWEEDSGWFPASKRWIKVTNIGWQNAQAVYKYGTKFGWIGNILEKTIAPNEAFILKPVGAFYVAGVFVTNPSDKRKAIVSVDTSRVILNLVAVASAPINLTTSGDLNTTAVTSNSTEVASNFTTNGERQLVVLASGPNQQLRTFAQIDPLSVVKQALSFGLSKVPFVGEGLSFLLDLFWPESKANVWDEIRGEVVKLIDEATIKTITTILSGDIARYRERIGEVRSEVTVKRNLATARGHYVNVAEDMIGLELKFRFQDELDINFNILPLFSTVVLMKTIYYTYGIDCAGKIGLSEEERQRMVKYRQKSIDEANKYIDDLYEEKLYDQYDSLESGTVYDDMVTVRTFATLNGLEFKEIWNGIVGGSAATRIAHHMVSYSPHFGRTTKKLDVEALRTVPAPPLTPTPLSAGGARTRLIRVGVYTWRINGAPRIGGVVLNFANGESYTLGTVTTEYGDFSLENAAIKAIEVRGSGAVDWLRFALSDGRTLEYGAVSWSTSAYVKFEQAGYIIASMFVASDTDSLVGQAANLAVSYQWDSTAIRSGDYKDFKC